MTKAYHPHTKLTRSARRKQQAMEIAAKPDPRCDAKLSSGARCRMRAGWGTDHPGIGACKKHGGNTADGLAAAGAREAAVMGAPLDIDPFQALLWCVQIAAGEVEWLNGEIAQLDEAVVTPITRVESEGVSYDDEGNREPWHKHTKTEHKQELNLMLKVRHQALDRLANYSAMCIKAGIEERQVRIAERYGETIARLLEGVLTELRLTDEQRRLAPDVVRRNLAQVSAGTIQSTAKEVA